MTTTIYDMPSRTLVVPRRTLTDAFPALRGHLKRTDVDVVVTSGPVPSLGRGGGRQTQVSDRVISFRSIAEAAATETVRGVMGVYVGPFDIDWSGYPWGASPGWDARRSPEHGVAILQVSRYSETLYLHPSDAGCIAGAVPGEGETLDAVPDLTRVAAYLGARVTSAYRKAYARRAGFSWSADNPVCRDAIDRGLLRADAGGAMRATAAARNLVTAEFCRECDRVIHGW